MHVENSCIVAADTSFANHVNLLRAFALRLTLALSRQS